MPHWLAVVVPLTAVVFGWFATASCCEVAEAEDPEEVRWVRTADGWERAGATSEAKIEQLPPLHPGVMAAAMFILSAGCLAVGECRSSSSTRRSTASVQIADVDRL